MTEKTQVPTDPEERKAYFSALGKKGGENNARSDKAVRPFRDKPGLAKKAGSVSGYTFKRKKHVDDATDTY